jgi:hypothetical protein
MTILEAREARGRRQQAHQGGGPTVTVLVGGVCGLAWAAGLRGFMAQIAGSESSVDWAGTFGWILLPGIGVGALLG